MTTLKTDKPQLSDATIARIRAAAHRFVLAGGSIFPSDRGDDRDEHIGNVLRDVHKADSDGTFGERLRAAVTDFETYARIEEVAQRAKDDQADAAFLFGAFVGLEMAALTFCQLATVPASDTPQRPKGGRR